MNRAERRRLGKQKEKTYTLNSTQIENIKKECTQKALDQAMLLMLGLPVMVMHDKYPKLMKKVENGKSREERFSDMLIDLYDSFQKGFISLDDVRLCLEKECGIKIDFK